MEKSSLTSAPLGRREFLRVGLAGFATLSLPGLLQLRALAGGGSGAGQSKERRAVILVWLRGGASHLDTYDPKPDAPSEFRGPFRPIATRVPGLRLGELLPLHAKLADKFTIVRSMSHTGAGHPCGTLQMLSGDTDTRDKPGPIYPDWMSVANSLLHDRTRQLPNYVGVNPIDHYDIYKIAGPAYLNPAYGPFVVKGDPSAADFEVQNIGLSDSRQIERLARRVDLKQQFDQLSRAVGRSSEMNALDEFEAQALGLLTSREARDAFDLSREPDHIRDRYGRNAWGQQCLMARRLVEAGVEIITTTFDGPLCGRVKNWDDHAVNHNIFDALRLRLPPFDQAVAALVEDIYTRGLDRRVLVVVTGEFGRSPRINIGQSTGGGLASGPLGTTQPGREHWPQVFSQLWAGGGIPTGRVIGASDRYGEAVADRRLGPGDFLATIYHHLGIDAERITLPDFAGRPTPILPRGKPIAELLGPC